MSRELGRVARGSGWRNTGIDGDAQYTLQTWARLALAIAFESIERDPERRARCEQYCNMHINGLSIRGRCTKA